MEGYAKLASFIGQFPEVAVFRRFGALNAQNLLYLQAEIIHLEARFRREASKDAESDDRIRKLSSKQWFLLSQCGNTESQSPTWQTFLELRHCLKQYSTSSFKLVLIEAMSDVSRRCVVAATRNGQIGKPKATRRSIHP